MRCPNCGAEAGEHAWQCSICGTPLLAGEPRTFAAVSATGAVGSQPPRYVPPPPLLPPPTQPTARCLACGAPLIIGMAQCPSCGSNASIFGQARRGANRRWPLVLAIIGGVVVAAAVAVVAFLLFTSDGPSYPSHWDARVAPIATRVEELRGLTFRHPVAISYLSDADFEKRLTSTPEELKKQHQEIEDATALFRAIGFIGAKVDLSGAVDQTQAADTIAFYDEETKAIYVRGSGAFTVETRVTLAHELTHVLQDQHFDLAKLRKQANDSKTGSSDALTALVEGDAVRIEHLYLSAQTPADRNEYTRLSAQGSDKAGRRTKDIPAVVGTYFSAPYVFGPQVIRVLQTSGGNAAINAALTGPALTTRIYLDPTATGEAPLPPPVPALKAGENKLATSTSDDDNFDDFTLYLMLGARLDPPTALQAADAFSAGSEVLYRRSGVTCFRAAIVARTATANAFLRTVLGRWVASMPDAAIDAAGPPIEFHSCDSGARATTPSARAVNQATALAAGRDEIVASFVAQHIASDLASCAARLLVRQPHIRDDILNDRSTTPRSEILQLAAIAGRSCRSNPEAGIP
jgi:hypothetical protein